MLVVESAGVVVMLILQLLYYSAKMPREPLIAGYNYSTQGFKAGRPINAQPPINVQIKACVKQKREVARANGSLYRLEFTLQVSIVRNC